MVQEGKQQVATLPYEAQRGRGRVESPIKYQFFFPSGICFGWAVWFNWKFHQTELVKCHTTLRLPSMEEYFERPLYLKVSDCFSSIQNSDFPPKMLATAKRVYIQILS